MFPNKFLSLPVAAIAMAFVALTFSNSLVAPAAAENAPSSPVAYVYVASNPTEGNLQINAFSAAPNGQLTPVPGSPFPTKASSLAVIGAYLFGTDGVNIYSYAIASNGALTLVSTINAQSFNGGSGGPTNLFLDHTGATLYTVDFEGANYAYQSFAVNHSNGVLTYLGVTTAASVAYDQVLSFVGNNQFAYSSDCIHFNPAIFGFQRNGDGTLTELDIAPAIPAAPAGDFYCPYLAAADPNSNLAVSLAPLNDDSWQQEGPTQLAVYTADASGNLTTASTDQNMPGVAVQNITDLDMAPSGKLLAVAGTGGAQVFHFNGNTPIMPYTGLLTKEEVDQVFWDNSNHVYAISRTGNQLLAGTVTPTTLQKVPGSPYRIVNPVSMIVLPKN